jgi:transcriptional regulator with XRE-family HTH domain
MKGQDLKFARLAKKWTQQRAARFLGVSQGYVSLLEREHRAVPGRLVPKLLRAYEVPPATLPVFLSGPKSNRGAEQYAESLGALGYPGFSYLKGRVDRNPAGLLLDALMESDLDSRVAEGLPWVAFTFTDLDWDWSVKTAKLNDVQNRLGFVVMLARRLAEKTNLQTKVAVLADRESGLERSRLAREDTFCHESLTEAERRWLRKNRSAEAQHWNLLTDLSLETLTYAS